MPKIYNNKNVFDSSMERLEYSFNHFDNIYLSISGGKDSSVMLQLASIVARKLNKTFDVLFIDLEAQYNETINHINRLKIDNEEVINNFYWICLPLSLRNAVSVLQPTWICWDKKDETKWVREMPENCINEDNNKFKWFYPEMEFEEFILLFAKWYNEKNKGITGVGIGIRADESLNRFRTLINQKKQKFNDKIWTTQIKINNEAINVFNFYPLYDFKTSDIWGVVSHLNLDFNNIYELLYKNGVSIHQQRLCQPYGDDQRNSLDQFRYLEPKTWEKVLQRVEGANFGNIYARTSLLGNIKSEKPENITWQQYSVFLLESLGLYAPELRDHYYRKIKKFIDWYDKKGIKVSEIPDMADKKLESSKKFLHGGELAGLLKKTIFG